MMPLGDDQHYMAHALELASNGVNTTTPNPRVGCVIVQNREIIADGWHVLAGQPHAEIIALQQVGDRAKGATVYVTLEPCCIKGRTGPCTDALIAAKVARVVYAMQDPNPAVNGRGSEKLIAAGISVTGGVKEREAIELNRGFTKRMTLGLPWVMAKTASSLDGRIAMASGESQWITGASARQKVQQMRAASCAMLTGVGTLLEDNPVYTVRQAEAGFEVLRQPALIVVDSHLRTPHTARIFSDELSRQRRIICAYVHADKEKLAALEAVGAECWQIAGDNQNRVKLPALLQQLGREGFNELMLECGSTLLGSFVAQELVDELIAFIAPKLMGATAKPLLDLPIDKLAEAPDFSLDQVQQCGNDLMLCLRPKRAD